MESKIKAVTQVKEWNKITQIGVMFEEDPKWYNVRGTKEELEELLNTVYKKGNTIVYDLAEGVITNTKVIGESSEPQESWEDDIVNFETLLDVAHTKFKILEIKTELKAFEMEDKYAVCKATVIADGNTFEAHGDATQENCKSSMIKPHFIRMSETRAIARALRWATNNAKVTEEEK